MNGILDSVMARSHAFRPESVAEFTALQLARKLGDPGRLSKYLSLIEHHTMQHIARALMNAQTRDLAGKELITAFELELAALTTKDDEF